MKRLVMLTLISAATIFSAGCGDGMADNFRERQERLDRIAESDMKQLIDDCDMFWLNDDVGRLSKWRVRAFR